jgi:hypothetical protein
VEMAVEEKMKDGMSRQEALRAARLERGRLEVAKKVERSAGWESLIETYVTSHTTFYAMDSSKVGLNRLGRLEGISCATRSGL